MFSFLPGFLKILTEVQLVSIPIQKKKIHAYGKYTYIITWIFHSDSAVAFQQTATTLLVDNNHSQIRLRVSDGQSGSKRVVLQTIILIYNSRKEKASDKEFNQYRKGKLAHLFILLLYTKICVNKCKAQYSTGQEV